MKLEGKAFIITGGAGSIGGAAARNIIAEGGIAVVRLPGTPYTDQQDLRHSIP